LFEKKKKKIGEGELRGDFTGAVRYMNCRTNEQVRQFSNMTTQVNCHIT